MKRLILITAFIFLCITLLKSWHYTSLYGGVDLRMRIVGARLTEAGKSPYFHKWSPADGERLLFPSPRYERRVNGNVVTPAFSYLLIPYSRLGYSTIRYSWTIFQYLVLVSCFVLLMRGVRDKSKMLVPASVCFFGLVTSDIWLYNIERGQVYVIYAFVFCILFRVYQKGSERMKFFAGMLCGLMIFLRPFFAVVAVPFFVNREKKWMTGWLAGLVLGVLVFVLPDVAIWKEYFAAMQVYAAELMRTDTALENFATPVFPSSIEGMDNVAEYRGFKAGGMNVVSAYLYSLGVRMRPVHGILLYMAIVAGLCFFYLRNLGRQTVAAHPVLFAFLLYILAEICMVAPRGGYNLIQWILPVCLLSYVNAGKNWMQAALILGLLLLHDFPFQIKFGHDAGEAMLVLVLVYTLFSNYFPATGGLSTPAERKLSTAAPDNSPIE
ncbi:MAG: DUF2029 domain-containing protein [Gemmatimonadaceae bacterium]|nr:DUF2029 domain-containing protein [Chitinophagaceae bacterium]